MPKRTQYWRVDRERPDLVTIKRAAALLRSGGLVAFPTETVYALGANALGDDSVASIFVAKGRPEDNPLIVLLRKADDVLEYASCVSASAMALMQRYWPGPLTLVLPSNGRISPIASAGLPTVAFRVPAHPVALALLAEAGLPVAAPSANVSGRPSGTRAQHVYADLCGRVDAVLDGGPADLGVESTVVDMTGDVPLILRPGPLAPEEIEAVASTVTLGTPLPEEGDGVPAKPRSPGVRYRHYAPSAPMLLVEGDRFRVVQEVFRLACRYREEGLTVGVLCRTESAANYDGFVVVPAGKASDLGSVGAELYDALRAFDDRRVDVILAEGVEPHGLGLALADRLRRAAGGRIIEVE